MTHLIGKRYQEEKKENGGDRKSVRHSDGVIGETATTLGKQYGVSGRTVERAADYAEDFFLDYVISLTV